MEHPFANPAGIALLPARVGGVRGRDGESARRAAAADLPDDGRVWASLFGEPSLTAAEQAALEAISQTRRLPQGQSVFGRTSPAQMLVALRDGDVALGFRTADGTFRTERIVRGPAWVDLSSAWLGEAHAMDAQASSLATVIELPIADLQAQVERHPGLGRRLIQCLAQEVQALAVNTHELMHKDAPARLAQWLRQRCEPVSGREGQAVVQLHERKRDVASQLAITPETLSRLMRNFTRQGVIEVAGYTVRVLDTAALGQLAEA